MSSDSNLTAANVLDEVIDYVVTQPSENPSASNFPDLPLSATLLTALCVVAVTLIAYVAIKAGGSFNITLGENSLDVHGNQRDSLSQETTNVFVKKG